MQTVRRASCGAGGEGFLGEGSPNAGKARASRVARMVSAGGQRVAVQLTADEATKRSVDCTVRWSCEARLYLHAPTLREGLEAAVGDECVRGARSASFKSGNPLTPPHRCAEPASWAAAAACLPACAPLDRALSLRRNRSTRLHSVSPPPHLTKCATRSLPQIEPERVQAETAVPETRSAGISSPAGAFPRPPLRLAASPP